MLHGIACNHAIRNIMKIDMVTDTFVPDANGVAMTLGHLTGGLRQRGHRVHVIHTGVSAKPGETCVAAVPLPGYKEVPPHFPALRSDPMALSGACRRKQITSSSQEIMPPSETPMRLSPGRMPFSAMR